MSKVLVTGAGGFIGHHLVTFLKGQGYWVRGVDQKTPEYYQILMPMSSCSDSTCGAGKTVSRQPRASTKSMQWLPIWVVWASSHRTMLKFCITTH